MKQFNLLINKISKNEFVVWIYVTLSFWLSWLFDIGSTEDKNLFVKIRPFTMVSYKRLKNVYEIASQLEREKIKGSFVECGVWKGGSSAILPYVSQKYGSDREIHLFDSFEGLPEPTKDDGEKAIFFSEGKFKGALDTINKTVGSINDVKSLFFSVLKLNKNKIFFHKGWFQTTIPNNKSKVGKIALLRIDADWYESTKLCLEELYPQVIKGGYIIIDDYGWWEGAKKAVDEYMLKNKIQLNFNKIDFSGIYFHKS